MSRFLAFILAVAAVFSVCGCPSQPKPTAGEVQAARTNDPAMRTIDNARKVAGEESSRKDDAALN